MYFSKLQLNPKASPKNLSRLMQKGNYGLHQAIWDVFEKDPDKERDFLYRLNLSSSTASLPEILLLSSQEPRVVGSLKTWLLQSKPFQPQIEEGERFAFSVRVNPVIRKTDAEGKKSDHDVIMDAKMDAKKAGSPASSRAELIRQASLEWLLKRAEGKGFELERQGEDGFCFQAEGYMQHKLFPRGRTSFQFSSVDLQGRLRVRDEELFRQCLFSGLGRARGFGCGLFMIRRV